MSPEVQVITGRNQETGNSGPVRRLKKACAGELRNMDRIAPGRDGG